ncbi:uncharacterized protein J3D65DRAFT_632745 [Phyllosticta citribraziliensis]|uniref:Uncharacterized protein n=1 Tax=Phyllosticta citribraziliensis TaxID=989973 RepID=A0ABR1LG71_9PEZI
MKTVFAAFPLFIGAFARAFKPALETLTVPVPTEGSAFTSTVPACGETVSAFVVVAVPNGDFVPGTQTIFLPPQAEPTTSTFINLSLNATQVVVATPLGGTCEPFALPSGTSTGPDTSATSACPLKGCAAGVNKAGQSVIEAINKVTLLSENLQPAAKQLFADSTSANGRRSEPGFLDTRAPLTPLTDLLRGLREVISTLTPAVPRITVLPPFPPGCDTDAIVVALTSFVRVHQALLNIIIGRSGLLESSPFAEAAYAAEVTAFLSADGGSASLEARQFNTVGSTIAAVLRGVEGIVDQLAFALIDLIPARSECAKGQKSAIDGTLDEAIDAYE